MDIPEIFTPLLPGSGGYVGKANYPFPLKVAAGFRKFTGHHRRHQNNAEIELRHPRA